MPSSQPSGVSILIAAHNRCELLAVALDSLRGVRVPAGTAAECIVVANACTDDTEGVVRRAAGTMPFPTRAVAEPRRGVSFARNRAVQESRHAVCLFLDSDCLADPAWLAEHLRMYAEHDAGLVTGRIDLWWAETPDPGWLSPSMREALGEHHSGEHGRRLREPRAYAANFSFRRELFNAAGPFRTDIGRSGTGRLAHEEQVFAARAMAGGAALWWAPAAMVRHHVPASSLSGEFFRRSAYWGSVSRMMTVEPFGAGEVARALLVSPLRAAICQVKVLGARLRDDPHAADRARMDRAGAVGRIKGAGIRLWKQRTSDRALSR